MGVGLGIFLITIGAIFTWAVEFPIMGVDLQVPGVTLMSLGVLSLLVTLVLLVRQRRVA